MAMSSMHSPSLGNTSLTSTPDLPILLNLKGEGNASPSRPGSVLSTYCARVGFGSQVSTWEGPPDAKIWMTALALAGSGAVLGASGPRAFVGAVAALWARLLPRIEARLIAPKP